MKATVYILLGLVSLFVLAALFMPAGLRPISTREVASVFVNHTLEGPLERFRSDIKRYPTTDEGTSALSICPSGLNEKWKGPYIEVRTELLDPWKHAFRYRSPGVHNPSGYDLWSLGPDGRESDDDIGNWKK